MKQKYGKYTNQPITKDRVRRINFGSASVKRRKVGMPKFNLKEIEEEENGNNNCTNYQRHD